jgi:hypothetical protein
MDKLKFKKVSIKMLTEIPKTVNDAGCNGPYKDPETPFRRLAHILKLAAYWERENEFKISKDVEMCLDILHNALESRANLPARASTAKDNVNGVIGPAWIIEGLGAYNVILKSKTIEASISKIVNAHRLLPGNLVWNRLSEEGLQLGPDLTFNHQIWFNEMVLKYSKVETVREVAANSLVLLLKKLKVYNNNGIICHLSPILVAPNMQKDMRYFRQYLSGQRAFYRSYGTLVEKSIGYHSFNLCSLVRSALTHPKVMDEFNAVINSKLSNSLFDKNFFQINLQSKYGNSYNPIYAELGQYAIYTKDYKLHEALKSLYYVNQYANFDFSDTDDPITRSARIYEYVDYFSMLDNKALL